MTYAGKEEKSPAKDNHSNVDFRHSLKYGRFDPIELTLPMDWTMNPFGVLNWRHNFLSLRWLTKSMPLRKKRSALFDFFEFHATQKKANDMIGTRLGDHTTSIRLSHVQSMLSEFIEIGDKEAALICKKLMKRDIYTLLSPDVYRAGHNHGVMADISILAALDSIEDMDSSISETVAQRGFLSLASIFDESGITQEHSISYQEHNYPVALKFLHASAKLISTDEQTTAKNLSKGSSELLSFFTRANGEYFPVGDSFRLPNLNIRKLHPEIDAPFVSVDGPDFSPKIFNKNGFFAYINNIEGRRLHFTSCCAWHSANHKQDDDLSFCLELDGELVFDDAGYSDQASRSVNDALRSAGHHSTVELPGHPYTARNKTNHKSKLSESLLTTSGFKLSGSHQRIPGVTVTREFTLTEKTLTITDILTTDINTISEHGFVLAHDIEVRIKNSNIMLYRGFKLIGSLESANNEGDWLISRINHVRSNRSDIAHTTRLAFRSFNNKENTFIFVFY